MFDWVQLIQYLRFHRVCQVGFVEHNHTAFAFDDLVQLAVGGARRCLQFRETLVKAQHRAESPQQAWPAPTLASRISSTISAYFALAFISRRALAMWPGNHVYFGMLLLAVVACGAMLWRRLGLAGHRPAELINRYVVPCETRKHRCDRGFWCFLKTL